MNEVGDFLSSLNRIQIISFRNAEKLSKKTNHEGDINDGEAIRLEANWSVGVEVERQLGRWVDGVVGEHGDVHSFNALSVGEI